ncbi:MAG: HEAT repeat domain-containing protein, partial [Acidobacteriota bacterium]
TLLGAPSPSLRFEAARTLIKAHPDRSDAAVRVLVELAPERSVDAYTRRVAIALLSKAERFAESTPVLAEILDRPDDDQTVRSAALEGLRRAEAFDEIVGVRPVNVREARTLLTLYRRIGHAAQPRLLELLTVDDEEARDIAIDTLRRVGDLDAIPALHGVAESGTLWSAAAARAARRAIDEITDRLGGTQSGELSVVRLEPLDGALSPTNGSEEGGELSLSEESPWNR